MKWPHNAHFDTQSRVIFALNPRRCSDGMTRWLERVRVVEMYDAREDEWFEVACHPVEQSAPPSAVPLEAAPSSPALPSQETP